MVRLVLDESALLELGSESRDKFMASGQQVAVKGTVLGYYLFKRCEPNKREMEMPWEIPRDGVATRPRARTSRLSRRIAVVVAVAAVAAVTVRVAAPAPTKFHPKQFSTSLCGVQRWAVKTMTDSAANRVNLRTSRSTIDTLIRQRAPARLTPLRRGGIERTTFQVKARLVSAKIESDGDVHLVIASPTTGRTMIAEVPSAGARPTL